MVINGVLKYENLTALQKDFIDYSPFMKKRITLWTTVSSVVYLLLLLLFLPKTSFVYVAIYVVITLMFALIIPGLLRKRIMKKVTKKLKKEDLSGRLGDLILTLNEGGVILKRGDTITEVGWKEIARVTSDDEHWFLYYGKQALIIPKSYVENEENLMTLLKTYLPSYKITISQKRWINKKAAMAILIFVVIGLFSFQYYIWQPERDLARATYEVNQLFIETEETSNSNTIKASIEQENIDNALRAVEKLDTTESRYERYTLLSFGLLMLLNEAQEQLNEREMEERGDDH